MKDLHVLLVLLAFVVTIHGFTRFNRRNKPRASGHLSRDLGFNHLNTLPQHSYNADSVEVVYERNPALAPTGTSKERTISTQPRSSPTSRNFSSRKKRLVPMSPFERCIPSHRSPGHHYDYDYECGPFGPIGPVHYPLILIPTTTRSPPPPTTTRTTTTTPLPTTTTRTTTTTPATTTTRTTTRTPTTAPVPAPHKTTTIHCYELLKERYPVLANTFWDLFFNDKIILRIQAERKIIRSLSESSTLGNQSPPTPTPTQKTTQFPLKRVDFLSRTKRSDLMHPFDPLCLQFEIEYGFPYYTCVHFINENRYLPDRIGLLLRLISSWQSQTTTRSSTTTSTTTTTTTSKPKPTTTTTTSKPKPTTTTTTSKPKPTTTTTTKLLQETTSVQPESFKSSRALECYDLLGERYRFLADIFWDIAVENCDYCTIVDESEIKIDSSIQKIQDTPITTTVPPPTSTGKTTTTTIPTTTKPTTTTTTTKPTTTTTTTKPTTTTITTKPTTTTITTKPTTTTTTKKPTITTTTTKPTTTTTTTKPTTTTTTTKPTTTTTTTKPTTTTTTTKPTTTKPTTTTITTKPTATKPTTTSTTKLTASTRTTKRTTTKPTTRIQTTKSSTATTTTIPTTTSTITTTEECPEITTIQCYNLLSELYPVLANNLRDVFFNDSQIVKQQAEKEINRLSIDSSIQINRIPPMMLPEETDTFQQEWILSCKVVDCYNLLIESYPFLEDILWGMVMELEKSYSNGNIDFNIDANGNYINTTNTQDENAT